MKLGLAFSGGGAKGIAHAGVLKAFLENSITPSIVGGTSSGSIVATLYAMGYSPDNIFKLFKKYSKNITNIKSKSIINEISKYSLTKKISINGLNSGEELSNIVNRLSIEKGIKSIEDLKIPLVIPAVDILEEKEYIFSSVKPEVKYKEKYITDIDLGTAVRASSSFTGVYSPCTYKNKMFLDGGLVNNTPVKELKECGADKVIAINFKSEKLNEKSNIVDIVMKSLDIMSNRLAKENLEKSDILITLKTSSIGLLDINKSQYCFDVGYNAALEYVDEIKKLLLEKN